MKKFNIDELIWFIILILLAAGIIFLIRSEEITNFVSAYMLVYFYISVFILGIFIIFQFNRIFTVSRKIEITNKFIPITFTLIIGGILFFIMPIMSSDNNFYDDLLLYYNDDVIVIDNENYTILDDINENKEKYEGKTMVFLGYIDEESEGVDETLITREKISCCQADKEKIQIKVKGLDTSVKSGQWISIAGKISFDDGFYINVNDYRIQNKPKDIYYHEHL